MFCSCERYGTEVEDMMIIEGIAIDKEKELFEVTVEMLNNKQSASADASNVGDEMTLVYSAKGETVAEALRLIINKTGNVPTYIHNKVIILSEEVAKTDITNDDIGTEIDKLKQNMIDDINTYVGYVYAKGDYIRGSENSSTVSGRFCPLGIIIGIKLPRSSISTPS